MKKEKTDYVFPFACGGPILTIMSIYYGIVLYTSIVVNEGVYLILFGVFIIPLYVGIAIIIDKIYNSKKDAEDKEIYKYHVEVELTQDHKKWDANKTYNYECVSVYFTRHGYFDRMVVCDNDGLFSARSKKVFECPVMIIKRAVITVMGNDNNVYNDLIQEHRDLLAKHPKIVKYHAENASFFERFYNERQQLTQR